MLRKAVFALFLCLGFGLAVAPDARAAPPVAAGVEAAMPASGVEQTRYYYRYRYYRPRYYRRRYVFRRYYRPRYYRRYRYYRPYHYRRRYYRFF